MNRHRIIAVLLLVAVAALGWVAQRPGPTTSGAMLQEAYVWQRAWTPAVTDAVREHASDFTALPVLAAEVKWVAGQPSLTRVDPDFDQLNAGGAPAYPVVRVGVYQGTFETNAPAARYLRELCISVLEEWAANGIAPAELQLDFDCPEAKLAGYRNWVETIRPEVSPTRLTITALPTWLRRPAFKSLAAATGGFVLQVHSFQPPKSSAEPYVLCDPVKTREYVDRAAALGIPFRVALPTYGYRLIFDREGSLQGIAAEGSVKDWPADQQAREVRANPVELAALIRDWTTQRPAVMQGIVWYRLPVRGDELNWPWPTLRAVMSGKTPDVRLAVDAVTNTQGLTELTVSNAGNATTPAPLTIRLAWPQGRLIAGDGLAGYELVETDGTSALLRRTMSARNLEPGERATAAWLRLSERTEVRVEY